LIIASLEFIKKYIEDKTILMHGNGFLAEKIEVVTEPGLGSANILAEKKWTLCQTPSDTNKKPEQDESNHAL